MSELSTRLHLRRKELGLSQEELAQRMGYRSKSSITKLEKGINDLPQSKVEELAAALETTPAYLLGLDTPCPPPGFCRSGWYRWCAYAARNSTYYLPATVISPTSTEGLP